VAPIDKLSVVLVALFGVIFLGEKLTAPNWLGVALITAARCWWRIASKAAAVINGGPLCANGGISPVCPPS
jgi:drug/metabolite transporter (DMT)-like permease